jgi:hypothetical protein
MSLARIATAFAHAAGTGRRLGGLGRALATLLIVSCWLLLAAPPARADAVQLVALEVARTDDGVLLDFTTRFALPRTVEDALQKGVPLHFVAQADLYRSRWYWRAAQLEEGASYYIEFSYRLDTSQLPRPMQIGLAGQADWNLSVERTLRLE